VLLIRIDAEDDTVLEVRPIFMYIYIYILNRGVTHGLESTVRGLTTGWWAAVLRVNP